MAAGRRAGALLLACLSLPCALVALAAPDGDHVCKDDEGKGVCPIGRVRSCHKDGALAGCVCPPGASASSSASACSLDAKAKAPEPPCVIPDANIGKSLGASLDFIELAVPSLRTLTPTWATETISANDGKAATLPFEDMAKLALAHEAVEGGAGNDASQVKGAKAKALEQKRDSAVDRAIEVRKRLLERFGKHAQADEQRVLLARSLLRRSAYRHVPGSPDREAAKALLGTVTTSGTSSRDASFILGEEAVREGSWSAVVGLEAQVQKHAAAKTDLDDAAYLAAAHARMAQARLMLGDLTLAKGALMDAITLGLSCAPRAECVSASAGARGVLPSVWAASGSMPRTMAAILEKGAMPRVQRVRPMIKLAEIFASGAGASCPAEAEEARAWAQVIK